MFQSTLDLVNTAAEHQRTVASALEVLRPVNRWKPHDAWLDIHVQAAEPDEPEDNRPYPGQYL